MALGTFDSRAVTKIEADNKEYLKAVAQIDKAHERAAAKRVAELQRQLELQGKTKEEAFAAAKAQVEAMTKGTNAAGKAIDVVGGKLKEFGKGLIGGAIGGVFAGIAGGGIGSVVQKLLAPPTPEEQRATLLAISRAGDAFEAFGVSAAKAAAALRDLDRAETALLLNDKAKADRGRAGGIVEKFSGARAYQRYQEQLAAIDLASKNRGVPGADQSQVLTLEEESAARIEAAAEYADTLALTDNLLKSQSISVKENTKAIKERSAALKADPVLLEWFKDQVAPTDTSAGRKILDAQAAADRMLDEDRAQRMRDMMADFNRAEEARRQAGVAAAGGALAAYKGRSPLEKIFGSAQEMQALGEAFGGFADAAGSAFEAFVTGSEGAGKAFRKFLSGSLLGIGKKAAVQAIYEIALAFAEPWDAGRHLIAAGKFGATAIAAGVAARALGGGGDTSAAGGAGAAAPTGNYSPGSGGNGGRIVFVYGDSFADDTPRMRQRRAERMLGPLLRGGPDDVN